MCYSIVSMVSQSTEVPAAAQVQSSGQTASLNIPYYASNTIDSPVTTSGYNSYASPAQTPEHSPIYDELCQLDVSSFSFDDPNSVQNNYDFCTSSAPMSPYSPQYPAQSYMEQPCNGYLSQPDPMQNGIQPQICPNPCYLNGQTNGFGVVQSSEFMFSNYPQCAEGTAPMPKANIVFTHQLCRICGDTASGNHFGVLSCEACKSFFRRSIRSSARYACRGSRNCSIVKNTRNRCQYCRLQKCLSHGMRKEAVQEERTSVSAKTHRATSPTPLGLQNLSFTPCFPRLSSCKSPTSPVPKILIHSTGKKYGSMPNLEVELDSSPKSSTGSPSSDSDVSVSALVNAEVQSESVNTANTNFDLFDSLETFLVNINEWANHIPAFDNLSQDEQLKLLKSCWCELFIFKLAAINHPKAESALLTNGVFCKRDQIESPDVQHIIGRVLSELSYWLDNLNADKVELACLKGILLFNPDAKCLSPASKKVVELLQEQILESMESRTKSMFPMSPQRFSKLLLRLAPVKAISLEVMQYLDSQKALGNDKLDYLFDFE